MSAAVYAHRARGRHVDAADHVEDGGLARSRRPGYGYEVALLDPEADAPDRLDLGLAQGVGLVYVRKLDDRHCASPRAAARLAAALRRLENNTEFLRPNP